MRVYYDCAMIDFDGKGRSRPDIVCSNDRLRIRWLSAPRGFAKNPQALVALRLPLQAYDVCLISVYQHNLSWARQALAAAKPVLRTPIVGLIHSLKAAAIDDLCNSGMADFIRGPVCYEELRARVQQLLRKPAKAIKEIGPNVQGGYNATMTPVVLQSSEYQMPPFVESDCHAELEAFALASAARCAYTDESFGDAKRQVINCFERAYLTASLVKSSGNIAMAARRAKKHRRAYWALLQKHGIDAEPFRHQCFSLFTQYDDS